MVSDEDVSLFQYVKELSQVGAIWSHGAKCLFLLCVSQSISNGRIKVKQCHPCFPPTP